MNSKKVLPESLICLIGPPRSGTTLIANALASHSQVTGLLEPYHRGRKQEYKETDLKELVKQNEITDLDTKPHLVMKETTMRKVNATLTVELLQSAANYEVYTGLILIFRCPFVAYLSQVSASQKYWREKKLVEDTEDAIATWAKAQIAALRILTQHTRAHHFRLVSYEKFCLRPASELARLMALIPENLQQHQLQFRPPKDIKGTADPKVREKSGGILQTDYTDQVNSLRERYQGLKCMEFMTSYRELILEHIGKESDLKTLDRLTRLVT